jgi:molybdate transport system substrate-binding protein
MQVLRAMKLDGALADRLVYGANVRQVLDYVERGEVGGGVVYLTDARQSGEKVKIVARADPAHHQPIEYPAVTIAHSAPEGAGQERAAREFLDYLGKEAARKVLLARGFSLPAQPLPPQPSPAGSGAKPNGK